MIDIFCIYFIKGNVFFLCVNIDVVSNKKANYGIFKSSQVECAEEHVTA